MTMRNVHAGGSTIEGRRLAVKTAWITRLLVVLTGSVAFATPRAYAQSEVDPDHFSSPNTESFPQSKTKAGVAAETPKVRFSGKFTLPYAVQCAGKKLPPGTYSVSLHSDGKFGRARLNQKSQTIEIAGVVRVPADSRERNALFVECIGKTHRLALIHVAELDVVFDPSRPVERASDGKPRRMEKLELTEAGSR
jgi:hypothetical protein